MDYTEHDDEKCEMADLVGKTFDMVAKFDKGIILSTTEGEHFAMFHEQACCECVYLEDVIGELDDLVGAPILRAEERSEDGDNPDPEMTDAGGNSLAVGTWTFYEFATIKGSVTFRWFGASNGYYSERAEIRKLPYDRALYEVTYD